MRYIYCPKCGSKLGTKAAGDDGEVPYCENCQKYWFDNFANCVIVLVYNEFNEIVLARQGYLSKQYRCFTSGYITPGESAEETAIREVKEELGLDVKELQYVGSYWFAKNDMLMSGFIASVNKSELHLSQEIDSAEWVPIDEAPKTMFPDSPGNAMWPLYRYLRKLKGVDNVQNTESV